MTTPRLTALSHGAGCACKLSLDELQGILAGFSWPEHDDLIVGLASGDDAAVWRQPDGRVMVVTTDFFTPLVDDPRDWGRIAVTNAVSDVYAMGATPRVALNLVGWPRDLDFDLLRDVLDGAARVASDAGYVIAGGHSIDRLEPLFGQVVIGDDDLLTAAYRAAVREMARLNRDAARIAREHRATAATDVTRFGLLGHLHRLALASGVAATLDAEATPLLPHVDELLDAGYVPGGCQRNADQAGRFLTDPPSDRPRLLLADAQTSGGLLFTVDIDRAEPALAALTTRGHHAAVVGSTREGPPGSIRVIEP